MGLVSTTCTNSKDTPLSNNDYSYHITAIELVLTNHIGSISRHITSLVINSLRNGYTHKHTYRRLQRNNFKKPGMHRQCVRFKNQTQYLSVLTNLAMYHHSWVQYKILAKSTRFCPYFGFC